MKRLINIAVVLSMIASIAVSASAVQIQNPCLVESVESVSPRTILEWNETYSKELPTNEIVYATVRFRYNDSDGNIAGISSVKYSCSSGNVSGLKTVATKITGNYATITFGYTYIPTGQYKTDYVYVYAPQ